MAITQARIIGLINAGSDYKQGFEALIKLIHQMHQRARDPNDPTDAAFALDAIHGNASSIYLLREPAESSVVIRHEEIHFRKNAKRNDHNRLREEERRRARGAPKRDQYVSLISPTTTTLAPHRPSTEPVRPRQQSTSQPTRQVNIESEIDAAVAFDARVKARDVFRRQQIADGRDEDFADERARMEFPDVYEEEDKFTRPLF